MNKRQQIKTLKCIQINLQRSKDSPSVLSDFIQSEDIDIAFIQEPYVIDHKICGFPLKLDIFYDKNCDLPKSAGYSAVIWTSQITPKFCIQGF